MSDPFGKPASTDINSSGELGSISQNLPPGVNIKLNPGDSYGGMAEGNHLVIDKSGNFRFVPDNKEETQEVMDNGGEFPLPPPGDYEAYLEDIESTYSKKGDPMVKYVFVLVDPQWRNAKIWDYVVLLKVPTIYLANMSALGCTADNLKVSPELIGRMVIITARYGAPYQGRVSLEKKAIKVHPKFATLQAYKNAQSGL